jgi:hypothetical protein
MVGFYFVFEKIASVKSDVTNLELSLEILKRGTDTSLQTNSNLPTPTPVDNSNTETKNTNTGNEIKIPSTIVFELKANPEKKISSDIILNIDSGTLSGSTLTFVIKAISLDATSSFSFSPKDLIQIVSLDGDNQKASSISGEFSNIQPKTTVEGMVVFRAESPKIVILQVGYGDDIRFFEFNFETKTYKEVQLG